MDKTKEILRVSGKKQNLPAPEKGWNFEKRPGGWIVATRKVEDATGPRTERKRFLIHESKSVLSLSMNGFLYRGEIQAVTRAGATTGGSDADLVSQFPGKVRKLLVKENQVVLEGEPLLLMEAMKMEFTVKAPFSGTVTKIHVSEAEQLTPGTRFLDLKPTPKEDSE